MTSPEHDPIADLADAVADGRPVDWVEASNSADDAQAVRALQVIAAIAEIHRQAMDAPTEEPKAPATIENADARRWGPLLVLEELGSGTFGRVFRAWDTTLDREVALKILKKRRRGGADSIVREGQLLARVSHPNVMAVYGAQEIDGEVGIWGEFLHGRTLARIVAEDGALSAEEAAVVADAISRALAAAHRAGLLHRDVKAQNVMREKGGRIVLMDFGLGRELARGPSDEAELAGTPLYLAPELFTGGRASVQSDIYSLGVLLFFLVTGTYPVVGKNLSEIRSAHELGRRQRLQDLRPDLPAGFVQTVERAIDPDASRRFESAGSLQAAVTSSARAVVGDERSEKRLRLAAWSGAAATVAAAAIAAWLLLRPVALPTPITFSIEPAAGTRFTDSSRNMPAISPDGTRVAMVAADNATGKIHLWLHTLETGASVRVPDSERAVAPFWSVDGKTIGYFEPAGTIKIVTLEGMLVKSIATAQEPRGAAWSAAGVLLYPKGERSGLYSLSTDANATESLVIDRDATRGELGYMWPQFLSDGDHFVYFVLSNDARVRGIYLSSLSGRTSTLLVTADASGIVARDVLLYVKGGNLVAQHLSVSERRLDGAPVTILENVATNYDWRSVVSVSDHGTLVYLRAQENTELLWLDRSGRVQRSLNLPAARYRSPVLSRDGTLLAVQRYRDGGMSEIQIFDLRTRQAKPSLAHSVDVRFPVWGPGHRLVYASLDRGRSDIYVKDFDRDDPPALLFSGGSQGSGEKMPTDWTSDGAYLLFVDYAVDRPYGLYVLSLARPDDARPLRPGEGFQYDGHTSPDGRFVLYARRLKPLRAGDPPERELWMCDFPSGDHPRLLATGGIDPAWPSNGEVSFFDRTGMMNVLPIGPDRQEPRAFPTGVTSPEASRNNYAWAPGGQEVLVNRRTADAQAARVMVLLNLPRLVTDKRSSQQ
jgi:serine/threonine-protein kinase